MTGLVTTPSSKSDYKSTIAVLEANNTFPKVLICLSSFFIHCRNVVYISAVLYIILQFWHYAIILSVIDCKKELDVNYIQLIWTSAEYINTEHHL